MFAWCVSNAVEHGAMFCFEEIRGSFVSPVKAAFFFFFSLALVTISERFELNDCIDFELRTLDNGTVGTLNSNL